MKFENRFISKVFYGCWFSFFLLFCLAILKSFYNPVICIFLGSVLYIDVLFLYRRFKDRLDTMGKGSFRALAGGLFLLLFAGLLITARGMLCQPLSDAGTIWFSAADVVENGMISQTIDAYAITSWSTGTSNHDYFLIYPNSVFLVQMLIPFCRMLRTGFGVDLRSMGAFYLASIYNACFILLSVFFGFLALKREKGKAGSVLFLLFCVCFIPFYLNAFRLYSDTMSMPFLVLAIWLCVEAEHRSGRKGMLFLFAGAAIGFGMLIKGSTVILAVGMLIYILVRDFKKGICRAVCLLVGILFVTQMWSIYSAKLPWLDKTESDRYEFPLIHWVMMASHSDGGYCQEDVDYSLSFDTLEQRKAADWAVFKSRVQKKGVAGCLKHLVKKAGATWTDGLFSQTNYLAHFENRIIGTVISPGGRLFGMLKTVSASFLWVVYLSILCSAWIRRNGPPDLTLLLHVCILGLILFFSLWETKSRYLVNYTPMMLMLSAASTDDLIVWKKGRCVQNETDPMV